MCKSEHLTGLFYSNNNHSFDVCYSGVSWAADNTWQINQNYTLNASHARDHYWNYLFYEGKRR